eukprot:TRINITY_DN10199_c0_g1_i1.p1 TRINITY_DN10199_c0_g1~~TRINITY_DN10199_c0_g1_i1.p1  ORF type:complete len:317 (-),score=59.56 TRINITY_DN10199_c0_g1_i1:72-977(-)
MAGFCATFIGSFISVFVFKTGTVPWGSIQTTWKLFFLLSISHGLTSAFENISIVYISVSLNQVIKATSPAGTIIASIILEEKHYSKQLIISTAVIVLGAILTVFKNPEFHWIGVGCAILSTLFGVAQTVIIARLLQVTKINVVIIALMTSLPAMISLMPGFMLWEYGELSTQFEEAKKDANFIFWMLLLISTLAYFYNMSHYFLIKYTSAHYAVLVGNMKVLILVFLSISIFGTPLTPLNLVGMFVSLGGFCIYNAFRYLEMRAVLEAQDPRHFTRDVVDKLISADPHNKSSSDEEELKEY